MNNFHINTTVIYSSFSNYLKNTTNILPLTNDKYTAFIDDLNLVVVNTSEIRISIFEDAAGTIIKVPRGRPVLNVNYTYEHSKKLADSVVNVDGTLSIIYMDGTKFSTTDTNTKEYWYSINGSQLTPLV
jgi:hypothetical protein